MRLKVRWWMLLSFALIFACVAPTRRVHAYVDPGTGNYLLQLLLAGLFGALFAVKVFWGKIRRVVAHLQALLRNEKKDAGR